MRLKPLALYDTVAILAFCANVIVLLFIDKTWIYSVTDTSHFVLMAFVTAAHLFFVIVFAPELYGKFGKSTVRKVRQTATIATTELRGIVRRKKAAVIVSRMLIRDGQPGFIYVMKREDGIYKIGYTDNTRRRLAQHEQDYGAKFELVYRFAVADKMAFERLALHLTRQYRYKEPGRTELRKMTEVEVEAFTILAPGSPAALALGGMALIPPLKICQLVDSML